MSSRQFLVVPLLVSLTACGGKAATGSNSTGDTSYAEQIASALSGVITSGDSSSGVALLNNQTRPLWARIFLPYAQASTCSTLQGSVCSSSIISLTYGGCNPTLSPTATWTGTSVYNFVGAVSTNSTAVCSGVATNGLLSTSGLGLNGTANSVTVTSTGGLTRTAASGVYVSIDSNSSGFGSPVSGGTKITCLSGNCSTGGGSRSVEVTGLHRAAYSASGTKLFDHTLNTSTDLTLTGTGASRVVATGAVFRVQHNLVRVSTASTITQALTFSSTCCFPTGGQIQTTYSGGAKSGNTETTTFSSTCGSITVGTSSATLTHCH